LLFTDKVQFSCRPHHYIYLIGSQMAVRLSPLLPRDIFFSVTHDRLCRLVVRVPGYRSRGPGSIPGATRFSVVGLERGPLSLVSTIESYLKENVAAPVQKSEITALTALTSGRYSLLVD
jgi:hypothetical protein